MSDWIEYKLDDVASVNPTESISKGELAKKVAMEVLQPFTKKVYSYSNEPYNGGMKFRNGDTIVARITPCLENGKTAYIDFLDDDEIGFGSTEYIVLREKENISDKHFLYYFSISSSFREVAILSMTGSSGRQRVQTDVVREHTFLLPSLPEQKAIAGVLSSLDDKIDLLHRQNKTLEAMAETLFRQWFDDKENESTISQLISIQNGYAFKSEDFIGNGEHHIIKIKNISGGIIDINNTDYVNNNIIKNIPDRFKIESGNILIAMTGAEIGKLGIIPKTNKSLWLNQRVGLLKEKFLGSSYLAYLQLKSEFGQDHIDNSATGSAQPNISSSGIENCGFPKLDEAKIIDYSSQIFYFYKKIIFNLGQIQTLEKLRDTLLPKLLNGEIQVTL